MADTGSSFDATALQGAIDASTDGQMGTKWVLIVETIDPESGEQQLERFASENSSMWDRMGMLEFSLECERLRLQSQTD